MQQNQNKQSEAVVSIRSLFKAFGENEVLRGVDLDLFQGENLVVLGRSGTGKSVLIKIIAGLLRPDSGTVNVLGKEVSRLEERQLNELRLQLGFSFQNSALYDSMSVKENLLFPLNRHRPHLSRAEAMKSIDSVLDAVGLLRAKNQMPTELSGGQKKRIGIARTLILQPKVMLYDEPTAGLDPITSTEINELITEVREKYGTSSIIITHDLTCAKDTGDRVAMLLEGVFAKVGTFADVFGSEDERIKSFYNYNFTQ
ncbi:MAG TPA: ATP-binding cassette domain-containing protein [Flavisolibacter sp.]|nr:ATP-binding cassette domain-containing protein [Flavisolibacter sp.]